MIIFNFFTITKYQLNRKLYIIRYQKKKKKEGHEWIYHPYLLRENTDKPRTCQVFQSRQVNVKPMFMSLSHFYSPFPQRDFDQS